MAHNDLDRPGGSFRVERRFARSLDALDAIFAFVDGVFEAQALDPVHEHDVHVAIDELVTNMVKHAPTGGPEIALAIAVDGDVLRISVSDFGVDSFDIRKVPPPPLDRPPAERTPGGLGIHLVRELMDGIDYHYADRTSTITLEKRVRRGC